MGTSKWIGGVAVAAFVGVSTVMAARFGWTLGATDYDQWLYAAAGGFADVLKAFLPLLITTAWLARQWMRSLAGAALFIAVTAYSLTSSFGLASIQRAEKLGDHAATATAYKDRRADLERLITARASINPKPVAASAEALAQAAVEQAEVSVVAECARRGPECRRLESIARYKRDELAALMTAKAAAKAAADLDSKIEAARAALATVDARTVNTVPDPQSAALARLTGRSEDGVRTALHALIAVLLELGSGLGLYVVFGPGHGRIAPHEQEQVMPAPDTPLTIEDPPENPESPAEAIERFVVEQVRPMEGGRVSGADLFSAYEGWCRRQGLDPVSAAAFGRQVPWPKGRVGGRVWYLDAALAS
jgi:hypothetical protein